MQLALGFVLLVVAGLGFALRSRAPGVASVESSWTLDDAGDAGAVGFAFPDLGAAAVSFWDGAGELVSRVFQIPPQGEPYREPIARTEQRYNVPPSLLARVLWQESRFRPDIVNGDTRSSAGAVGIAQFMPDTARDLNIDPLNVPQAIDAAGRYLRSLYEQFGTWRDAIAAYNWGPGNWRAFLDTGRGVRGQARPAENVNYVAEILRDVGV